MGLDELGARYCCLHRTRCTVHATRSMWSKWLLAGGGQQLLVTTWPGCGASHRSSAILMPAVIECRKHDFGCSAELLVATNLDCKEPTRAPMAGRRV